MSQGSDSATICSCQTSPVGGRERFLTPRKGACSGVPDWVCELLSPSTANFDRGRKLPLYATSGVRHCWVIDPLARTLDVMRLYESAWPSSTGSSSMRVFPCLMARHRCARTHTDAELRQVEVR